MIQLYNMASIIGIAGTAKNTGKTTTLNALLKESSGCGATVGITGIGYDGEDIDNITGLPKPRVIAHEGMIVSTSRHCVPASGWTIIEQTPYTSALGEIVIARCNKQSTVVVAGPKKRSDLLNVTRRMSEAGCDTIFVDGALNRIAPMSIVDRIIFTTGAARTTDIPLLVNETAAIERIFRFPEHSLPQRDAGSTAMIHSPEDVDAAIHNGLHHGLLSIPGLISRSALSSLCKTISQEKKQSVESILFDDPVMLLLVDTPERTIDQVDRLLAMKINILFGRSIALSAVTINPFYPEYNGMTYSTNYVDRLTLHTEMKKFLTAPVFDVVQNGADELWNIVAAK